MARMTDLPGGLLIPSRLTWATLAPNDGSTLGSSYSEAGPRPGTCEPQGGTRLRVQASGGQTEPLEVTTIKGGFPGQVQVAYKLASDPEEGEGELPWRGWDPPTRMRAWRQVLTAADHRIGDAAVIPSTQQIVTLVNNKNGMVVGTRIFDPRTLEATQIPTTFEGGLLCVLPDERVLAVGPRQVWILDLQADDPEWALYSRHPAPTPDVLGQLGSAVYHRGHLFLVSTVGDYVVTYVSDDMGVSFRKVGDLQVPGDPDAARPRAVVAGDNIIVTYWRSGALYCRTLAHAGSPLSQASERRVRASSPVWGDTLSEHYAVWAEPDGLLWAFVQDMNSPWPVYCLYSKDGGQSWTECQSEKWYAGDRSAPIHMGMHVELTDLRAVHAIGASYLFHGWRMTEGPPLGDSDTVAGVAVLGGWSNQTAGSIEGGQWSYESRDGWDIGWIPLIQPDNMTWPPSTPTNPWSVTGTRGSLQGGHLKIESANTSYKFTRSFAWGARHLTVEAEVSVSGVQPDPDSIVALRLTGPVGVSTGRPRAGIEVRLWDGGYAVYDVLSGALLDEVAVDLTTPLILHASLQYPCVVMHRRPGETEWVLTCNKLPTVTTTTADSVVEILHDHKDVVTSRWTWLAIAGMGVPANFGRGKVYGRNLGPEPIPLPDGWDDAATWIRAVNGPASYMDEVRLPLVHDYGLDRLFPELSPSPSSGWRSKDTSQQVFTFDLGADSRIGEALGLFVAKANFQRAHLEYYADGSWHTAGTLDLQVANGLRITRQGDTIFPSAASVCRYLWEGELAGGTAVLRFGAFNTVRRRIRTNSHGTWIRSLDGKSAEIQLEGVEAGDPTTGTAEVWAPSGLLVVYPSVLQRRRYWRVRIQPHSTADGYFEAGVILAGRIQPWGATVDWTQSEAWKANRSERRDPWGTTRIKEQGPLARTWTFSWNDGLTRYFRDQHNPDYFAPVNGLPLQVAEDVPEALAGILRETRSGQIPVVVIDKLPEKTTTITDPTQILYSRLSGSIQKNGWTDDAVRVESITADEVV